MKRKLTFAAIMALLLAVIFAANTMAEETAVNIPITANQAFDAVVKQVDPSTGENTRVALVDVRTSAEYFWVGACAKVESILTTSGKEMIPIDGKVVLKWGQYLSFNVAYGRKHRPMPMYLHVSQVEKVVTTDISVHVPTMLWDDANVKTVPNPNFARDIESLASQYDVLILMCRSGDRSNSRDFDTSLFKAVYEIDRPTGENGYGGFQGKNYNDVFDGYRGFPGRNTSLQDSPSVSWADAGLPTHIGWIPVGP